MCEVDLIGAGMNANMIIISKLKQQYLDFFNDKPKQTYKFAKYFKVNHKSSYRRLKELEKLGLVKRNKHKMWSPIKTNKEVISL